MKKGRTEVIEHQYINQHLHRRTEYYEAVGSNSTLEQNSAPVTGGRVPNSPFFINTFSLAAILTQTMSIYFYKIGDNKINSLTGIKCIGFPNNEGINTFVEKNFKVNSIEEYQLNLNKILANELEDKPNYFNEEYNHFSCIKYSVVISLC
jgi:hypothetical protein